MAEKHESAQVSEGPVHRVADLPDSIQLKILSLLSTPKPRQAGQGSERHLERLLTHESQHQEAPSGHSDRPVEGRGAVEEAAPNKFGAGSCAGKESLAAAVKRLKERGFAVVDGFQGNDILAAARAEAENFPGLREAGMGGAFGAMRWSAASLRGDRTAWLHEDEESANGRPALAHLIGALTRLRPALAKEGFDVDGRISVQLACYPGHGAGYVRHRDRSASSPLRTVTALYYLNPGWEEATAGGQLRLHLAPEHEEGGGAGTPPPAPMERGSVDGVPSREGERWVQRSPEAGGAETGTSAAAESGAAEQGGTPRGEQGPGGRRIGRQPVGERSDGRRDFIPPSGGSTDGLTREGDCRVDREGGLLGGGAGEAVREVSQTGPALRRPEVSQLQDGPSEGAAQTGGRGGGGGGEGEGEGEGAGGLAGTAQQREVEEGGGLHRKASAAAPEAERDETGWSDGRRKAGKWVDFAPRGDRLVLFRSDMWHEVLPAFGARYALTTWFSARFLSPPGAFSGAAAPAATSSPLSPTTAADVILEGGGEGRLLQPIRGESAPAARGSAEGRPAASLKDEIFVAIACYRDSECRWTIRDLFRKAEQPGRVKVGVVWQVQGGRDGEVTDLSLLRAEVRAQVRELRLDWREATGPCLGRHLAQGLWQGEEFYLQIDSHMRFASHWDTRLVAMLRAAEKKSSKPVLSTYPAGYTGLGEAAEYSVEPEPILLCASGFGSDNLLRIRGRRLREAPAEPIRSRFWAAGFSFSRAELFQEVPYSPHLPHLFFGEEMAMAVRMYTHGWDFFAPNESVVFHLWSRNHRPVFSRDKQDHDLQQISATRATSQQAVRNLLCSRVDSVGRACRACLGPEGQAPQSGDQEASASPGSKRLYGNGNMRSVKEFVEFCGVDFCELEVSEQAMLGGCVRDMFLDAIFELQI